MIEIDDSEKSVIVRALTRQFFALETVYRRNVNTNKYYADGIFRQLESIARLYGRLCDGAQFMTDSKSLHDRLYGQVKLELV